MIYIRYSIGEIDNLSKYYYLCWWQSKRRHLPPVMKVIKLNYQNSELNQMMQKKKKKMT